MRRKMWLYGWCPPITERGIPQIRLLMNVVIMKYVLNFPEKEGEIQYNALALLPIDYQESNFTLARAFKFSDYGNKITFHRFIW